jgi:hypothetical protein
MRHPCRNDPLGSCDPDGSDLQLRDTGLDTFDGKVPKLICQSFRLIAGDRHQSGCALLLVCFHSD